MSDELAERVEWTLCGRKIGRASGWDQSDTFQIVIYDFQADPGVPLPDCDLCVDFDAGLIKFYDDVGVLTKEIDLIELLSKLPRDDIDNVDAAK